MIIIHLFAPDATPLEKLAELAYVQADTQYLDGVREQWLPKRVLVLGVGFSGKELVVYEAKTSG